MKRAVLALAVLTAGCATIIEGRTQEVFMNVTPLDAECVAFRRGEEVGRYNPFTRSMHVPKSRRDMRITCTATGYQPADITASSSLSAWGVASFFLVDFGITDFATGALKKYPASITIVMREEGGVVPSGTSAPPSPETMIAPTRAPIVVPSQPPRPPGSPGFPPVSSSGAR